MTLQVMVSLLRQGQNGSQILDILDAITSEFQNSQDEADVTVEYSAE